MITSLPAPARAPRAIVRALSIGLGLTSLVLVLSALLPGGDGFAFLVPFLLVVTSAFGIVGIVVVARQPRNLVGWILYATGVTLLTVLAGQAYASYSVATAGGTLPLTVIFTYWANVTIIPLFGALGVFLPLLFPDGRLPSPGWRTGARVATAFIIVGTVIQAFLPGPLNGSQIPNPVGVPALAIFGESGFNFFIPLCLGVPMLIGIAATIARYRHGSQVVRQQLRWFGSAAALLLLALVVGSSPVPPMDQAGWLVIVLATGALPIAVGIAITRHRLYEIDRIISRTLAWASVTSVLGAILVATILTLQALLAPFTSGNAIAVAASTLLVFALFQPLMRRIRRGVDRRFDRARYDAERTAAAFAERLRDGADLATLATDLAATTQATLAPASLHVWIRKPEGGG